MKARRILSIILVVTVLVFTTTSVFAGPGKGNKDKSMPPGVLKEMILESSLSEEEIIEIIKENIDNLPPGIVKEIILGADLSDEVIQELYEEGYLDSLPSGILKSILSGDDNDEDDDDKDEIEVKGYITGIDVEDRVIEIDGEEYQLPEEVEVEIDEEEAELKDLEVGMEVELEIEGDEAKIDANSEINEEIEVEGTITGIDVEDRVIEIDEEEYQLPEEIEVEIDGEEAELDELVVGMTVELEIEDDEATIKAESMENQEVVVGSITDIDLVGNYHIAIDEVEYELSRNAKVIIGNEAASIEDIEISMNATVIILEDIVIDVNIAYTVEEISGSITGIDLEDRYIVIDEEEYPLASEVLIKINNRVSDIEALEVGMELQVELVNGEIVEINAQLQSQIEAEGTIMEIDLVEGYITIGDEEYELATAVEVKIDGEEATLERLIPGMTAEAELLDGKIIKIYANVPNSKIVQGEITDLDLIGIYHLYIDGVKYDLLSEAIVRINQQEKSLIDLKIGMSAMVTLLNNSIFFIDATNAEYKRGEITDLDLIGINHITIGDVEYELSEEAEVTIDGETATLDALENGMLAEIEIIDQVVTKIAVETITEVQGAITSIATTTGSIFIDEVEYSLADELEIVLNEEEATLNDLEAGMTVVAQLNINEEIIRITAEVDQTIEITEVQGSITEINIDNNNISIDNEEYYLKEELDMLLVNGIDATLEDLVAGMDIEVELHNGIIAKMAANDNVEEFSGEIVEVSFSANGMKLTIETDANKLVQYLVSEDLQGNNSVVLSLGDYGQFKVINNIIVQATIEN